MDTHRVRRAVRAVLILAGTTATLSAAPVLTAFGQERLAAERDDTLEVVVTGSRIKRIENEGPSPVISITADELNKRGYNTLLEALNDLPQNAGGGFDQQFTIGFTPSASAVDLRGFGEGRTLVLIDGRRAPVFPLAADGTDNFVDLSSIPVAAIDRIEVVTTGASAIYGSDAVSGVVNVILKKGTENALTLRRSDTIAGGGSQNRVHFATGLERTDGTNASLFAEYFEQDRIMFADRDFSRSDVLGGSGGAGPGVFSSFGNPGNFLGMDDSVLPAANCDTSNGSPGTSIDGLCRFNRAQYRELAPDMEHFSLTGKLDKPLADHLSFFARATYFTSNVLIQYEPVPADTAVVPASNVNNPAGVDGFWFRRTVEFGPREADIDNETYSVDAGLQGELGDSYSWEASAQYSQQRVTVFNRGYMRSDALDQAVTTGVVDLDGDGALDPINLFDPIPQQVVDAIRAEPITHGLSSITSVNLEVTGEMLEMRAGPAQFAFVVEFARQRFEDLREPDVLADNIEGLGGTTGRGDRKYQALGVELEIPIVERLSLNVAGRYDNYDDASDVGGAFSPRVALQYRPLDTLLLRAAAGKSFRAPDLQRLFGAETSGFDELIDTPTCLALGGEGRGIPIPGIPEAAHDPCVDAVQSTQIQTGANVRLTEEKGENVNLGVVWEAAPDLSVSVDFWYIKLEDIVNTPTEQFILDQNAATGAFADAIQRSPIGCDLTRNTGCLDIVSSTARNLSFQRARGVDATFQYLLPTGVAGDFTFKLGGTYLDALEIQELPSDPVINVLAFGELGEFVRLKGNATAGWSLGPWATTLFVNYIGPFTPVDATLVPEVGSYTTVNLSGAYTASWNGTIQLGLNNLFNEDPPLDLSAGNNAQPFYNRFMHDAYGMMWWASYVQRF